MAQPVSQAQAIPPENPLVEKSPSTGIVQVAKEKESLKRPLSPISANEHQISPTGRPRAPLTKARNVTSSILVDQINWHEYFHIRVRHFLLILNSL